jgi:diacylglycerol kinase family enzyme
MKVAVVINREGGSAAGLGMEETDIEDVFRKAGLEASVALVTGSEVTSEVRKAKDSSVDAVVIGGGDGTISAAAGVLAGGSIPLGVLPLGSANHFAQDLGIPFTLEEAVRIISKGQTRPVSVAEVNGHIFINNSVLGIYPAIVKKRDAIRHRIPMKKILARWLAALLVLPDFPVIQVRFTVDDRMTVCTTPFVFIGAHAYEMSAFSFGASRTAENGLFVYMIRSRTRSALVRLFLKSLVKDIKQEKYFETWSLSEVIIETHSERITIGTDGELLKLTPPLHYRSLPGALRVFVPPDDDE